MQNPFVIFAIFLILVGASHGALRRWGPVPERVWLGVEYFWLIGAALGLFAAGLELRRSGLQAEGQSRRSHLTHEWNQLRIQARDQLHILSSPVPQCYTEPLSDDCHVMLAWFTYAADALELGVDTQRWQHFLFQNANIDPIELALPPNASRVPQLEDWDFKAFPKTAPKEALERAQELLVGMRLLHAHLKETTSAEEGATLHWYDILARGIMPWYLTLAIAAKITRTTASLRSLSIPQGASQLAILPQTRPLDAEPNDNGEPPSRVIPA